MQTGDKSPEYLVQGNTVGVDEKAEEEANEKEENFTLQRRYAGSAFYTYDFTEPVFSG